MKMITTTLFGFCLLGLATNTTSAATLSILPESTDVAVGSTVPPLTISGADFTQPVDGVGVTVSWNPTILGYTGTTFVNPPWDTTYIDDSSSANGIINAILAGSSQTDGAGTDFSLAQLNFTALSIGSTDVLIGASGGGCVTGACGVFSEGTELLTDYAPATVNVVPIPAAVWLFGSGLLGLFGTARRIKNQ